LKTTTRIRRRPRRRGNRGATLVEFALVLPILVLLIFGVVDFGSSFNNYQALRNGTRNGTRDSVVINYGSNTSCLSTPSGGTATGAAQNIICHVKDQGGLGNNVRVGIWTPGGWAPGATLRICAQWKLTSVSGVTSPFINGKVITSKVEMRIEQDLPAAYKALWLSSSYTETAWSGTWPSQCTT